MVLGKLSVPGRPTNLDDSMARAYCACSRCGFGLFGLFSLVYHFSFLSPSLWETARYRLNYCLKGPLSPKQPTNYGVILVGQGLTALAVGAGGGCLDIFSLVYHFSLLSPSLWGTARYRLKYCLKGPLSPKQPTNHRKMLSVRVEVEGSLGVLGER